MKQGKTVFHCMPEAPVPGTFSNSPAKNGDIWKKREKTEVLPWNRHNKKIIMSSMEEIVKNNYADTKFIAENVYYLRKKELKMTQEAFSEKTNVSKETISNIEREIYLPNLETLVNISNANNVTVDYFLHPRNV